MKLADKSDKGKSGIYKITNIVNSKVYIGQSIDLWTRINEGHLQKLKKQKSHNKYLQRAWNKYGENNFIFEIIEYAEIDRLDEIETNWINKCKSHIKEYGYNLIPQGGSNRGYVQSEETKMKISDANRGEMNSFYGKSHTEENKSLLSNLRSIPIVQLTTDGELIKEWKSRKVAAEFFGIAPNAIGTVLTGKTTTSRGFVWMYKKDYEQNGYNKEEHFNKDKGKKPVVQLDMSGNYIKEYISMNHARKATGATNIHQVCYGRLKSSGGFKWILKENYINR